MTQSSYPTAKIQKLLEYLFYDSDDGAHYGWKDYIPVQKLLKNHPELLSTFTEIYNYQSSPTTAREIDNAK